MRRDRECFRVRNLDVKRLMGNKTKHTVPSHLRVGVCVVPLVNHGIRIHLVFFDLLWVTRLNSCHSRGILLHFLLVHLLEHVSLRKLLKLLLLIS